MNEPGVTRGGPAGRRLAVGSQDGAVARPVRPAAGLAAEVVRIGPTRAALAGAAGADDPATSRLAASPASASPVGAARRFTGTPRAGPSGPRHEFFTSSPDGTRWPRRPLELGPSAGQIALPVWWIDGDIATDGAGNLYATWDTQTSGRDIGWLSYSTNGGRTWSAPVRVTQDRDRAVHIVEVAGGQAGIGYVAWQTDAPRAGYATYVRPFSVRRGWLAPAVRVSTRFGNAAIWPGDTFGIATFPWASGPHVIRLVLSWGSAVGRSTESEIYAAAVVLRV